MTWASSRARPRRSRGRDGRAEGTAQAANRARFQVAALLLREERARVKTDPALTESERSNEQKRLDGLAGILAKTAARDTSLIAMLADDAPVTAARRRCAATCSWRPGSN
jgi:hypothetical protein